MRAIGSDRTRRIAGAAATAAIFAAAIYALVREAGDVAAAHLGAEIARADPRRLALALLATLAGYGVLAFYDVLGLRAIGRRLPLAAAAEGGFLSFAVAHNVGLGWLSAGAMRQRVYGPHGLTLADVARLTLMNSLTFFIGAFLLAGAALALDPALPTPIVALPPLVVRGFGGLLIAAVAAYVAACARWRGPVGFGRWHATLPPPRVAAAQVLLSCTDIALAGAALHFALPASLGLSYPATLGIYLVALSGSVLTHVPGGLGVFETLMLMMLPQAPRAPLLAGLILFRAVYYLLPLSAAVAWLTLRGGRRLRRGLGVARRAARPLVPLAAAAMAVTCGAVLLLSGATPGIDARLDALREIVPLPLLELSHLAASLTGVALIVLAHALYRRYDSAWLAALALLAVGAAASLLKGWDWEEALLLAAAAGALGATRDAFYRRGSLWRHLGSPGWLLVAALPLAVSAAVGFAAYADVPYRHELWWHMSYAGDAPRFLRATFAGAAMSVALVAARLLHAARQPRLAEAVTPTIEAIVDASPDSSANLARLGDKRFLVSGSGTALLMYQVEGGSWIAMGDPVGPASEWPALIWAFRDLADRHGGRPVFYEVSGAHLELYADAGLVGHKVGEEARVDLAALALDAPAAKDLRAARRRGEREGLSFEIVPAAAVPALIPTLAAISADWLAAKGGREKGFSLGRFDAGYLARFDLAVVRRDGAVVAFANLWRGGDCELSIDLMRHATDAPRGAMAFLLVELMMWGKARGFGWFNLGMAPLAGLAGDRLAPIAQRLGRLAYRHGEALYGFDGLRRFKEQFRPVWRSRYVVCRPAPTALFVALRDAARLIARAPATRRAAAPVRLLPRAA